MSVQVRAADRHVARVGMWAAWTVFALYAAYLIAVFASGAGRGQPHDPWWAIAEILTILGLPVELVLFAAIHELAPPRLGLYTALALAFLIAKAVLTTTVHFTSLVLVRRLDLAADPTLQQIFDFGQPSLVLMAELWAWHFMFGFSMLFASWAFRGSGRAAWIRRGLRLGAILALAGLIGPILGNPYLRTIGVIGYGLVFPIVCVLLATLWRADQKEPDSGPLPMAPAASLRG